MAFFQEKPLMGCSEGGKKENNQHRIHTWVLSAHRRQMESRRGGPRDQERPNACVAETLRSNTVDALPGQARG